MSVSTQSRKRPADGRALSAGFSLTETLVVLTVIGILLGVAMPNFVRIGRRDTVETAAYDLQRAISLARQKAIARRADYRLTLDTGARTFVVERRVNGTWVPDPPETYGWCDRVEALVEIGGSSANFDIEIEPQGTVAATDAPATIRFANCHGDTVTVSLVRTGRIRVLTASS